jgi:hypothetical protein
MIDKYKLMFLSITGMAVATYMKVNAIFVANFTLFMLSLCIKKEKTDES